MKQRVAITGLGMVSPFGGDEQDFFARITSGESAVRQMILNEQPRQITFSAVQCADFNAELVLGKLRANGMDRFSQFATVAALTAWRNAGLNDHTAGVNSHYGVSWGTSLGGANAIERLYRDMWLQNQTRVAPMSVVLSMGNAAAAHISMQLGLANVSFTYSVACASAAVAIGEAYQRIQDGRASIMLAGGSDTPLTYGIVRAWDALRVLANEDQQNAHRACRPFSTNRNGFVLGEGAAALVLENWDHAVARNAPILAELVGYGSNADASHLVKPSVDGQIKAIQYALKDGSLSPDDVDYVNTHGTATHEGDQVEIQALRSVFGAHAAELAVSATKSMHGHMMGATGAVEALITVMALAQDVLPPTAHLDDVAPACKGVRHIVGSAMRGTQAQVALSNSFAFGGTNVVLAFRKAD